MEQLRIISSIIVIFTFIMTVLIDSVNHNYTNAQEEADVIVILGGEDEGRMSKAAELYKAGYAESVLITPVIDHAEFYQSLEDAVRLG